MDARQYLSDIDGAWQNADQNPTPQEELDRMAIETHSQRLLNAEIDRMVQDELDRTRSDSCPVCGAWWEDSHYEECDMLTRYQRKDTP